MMDKTIKTRNAVKDIKVLDKRAAGLNAVRSAHTKTREVAERDGGEDAQHQSGTDFAQTKVEQAAKDATHATRQGATGGAKKAVNIARETHKAARDAKQGAQGTGQATRAAHQQAAGTAGQQAANATRKQAVHATSRQTAQSSATRTVANARQTAAAVSRQAVANTVSATKATIKQGAKNTVKTTSKSVKTASAAAKTTVKTSKHTAQAARATARATQMAARSAAQATRAATKATVTAVRAAARGIAALTKMAIAAVKSIISAIAAGGWVAVAVILVICLVGLIAASAFGIFFSGEDSGSGYTMPVAIREINQEYADKIAEVRTSNTHDEVVMSGTRAEWKEILALYAVKVNTDLDNPQDVATVDEGKRALLASVFWDMNTLEHHTETKEVVEVTVEDDGSDGFISTETTVTKTILYITVSHKTAMEMALQHGFSAQQKAQLAELLSDEYASLWSAVLYGIHNGSGDIVEVAISQIGNTGGAPYWSWYGFSGRVEWCATFVSWCANECGYIDAGIIPKFAACQTQGIPWFKERGLWQEPGYAPKPGDIIFFDWEQDGISDHVGIVEYVEGEAVHTIEGNTSDSVARRSYGLISSSIYGYGTAMY
jgi:hypothetical protein